MKRATTFSVLTLFYALISHAVTVAIILGRELRVAYEESKTAPRKAGISLRFYPLDGKRTWSLSYVKAKTSASRVVHL